MEGFFGDELGHLFGEEEVCSCDAANALGVWKGVVEEVSPFDGEERVSESPDDPGGSVPFTELVVENDEVVDAEGEGVLVELLFAQRGCGEGAEVDLDGFVGEAIGVGVGEAAEAFCGAGEVFVVQLREEEFVDQGSFAGEIDEGKECCGWAVAVDVAVGDEEGADACGVLGDEDLGGDASAVVGDEVDGVDVEVIEKRDEHCGLGVRGDGLVRVRLGEAEAHEIGRDAAAMGMEALEGSSPLVVVEGIAVEEESFGAVADVDVRDARHGEIEETPVAVVPGCIEGGGLRCDEVGRGYDGGEGGGGGFEEVSAGHGVSIAIGAEICAHVRMG